MAGGTIDEDDEISGINVTPLVDVMLVLLIIFMVTTSVIVKKTEEGLGVDKPEAATGQEIEPGASILLVCSEDGLIEVDEVRMSGDAAIKAAIEAKLAGNPDLQGIVQCDKAAQVGVMVHLIDLLREAGVKRYAIATQEPQQAGS